MYAGTYPDQVTRMVSLDGSLPTDDEVDQLIPEDERARVMAEQDANQESVDFYRTKAVPSGRLVEVQSSHDIDLDQAELVIKEINRVLDTA